MHARYFGNTELILTQHFCLNLQVHMPCHLPNTIYRNKTTNTTFSVSHIMCDIDNFVVSENGPVQQKVHNYEICVDKIN